MAKRKPRFYDPGVTREARTQVGEVKLNPAKKLASVSLSVLEREYGFRFVLPHLLYDSELVADPVEEYARQFNKVVPSVYWDAENPLITQLRLPYVQAKGNRLYAIMDEDMREVLNVSNATVFFHPENKRACRIEHQRFELYDFNAPKVGQLEKRDVAINVVAWVIRYADSDYTLQPDAFVQSVPTRYKAVTRKHAQVGDVSGGNSLGNFYELIERDANALQREIDGTEIESTEATKVEFPPGGRVQTDSSRPADQ